MQQRAAVFVLKSRSVRAGCFATDLQQIAISLEPASVTVPTPASIASGSCEQEGEGESKGEKEGEM